MIQLVAGTAENCRIAAPLLDKGLVRQKVEDKYPLEWCLAEIQSNRAQLWMAWEHGKLTGAVMTIINTYPSGLKYLDIFLLGGWKFHKWAMDGYNAIKEFALSQGCVTLAAGGRSGWSKVVKKYEPEARTDSLIAINLR